MVKYRAAHRDKMKRYQRDWYQQNQKGIRARKKAYREAHPEAHALYERRCNLKTKYGLTIEQYERLLHEQKGLCQICKIPGPLVIDHNHDTNKIRGLLCQNCNLLLGHAHDSTETLIAAIAYLYTEHNR
jgi:hypothetical protein